MIVSALFFCFCIFSCGITVADDPKPMLKKDEKTTYIPYVEIQTKITTIKKAITTAHLFDYAMMGNDFDPYGNLELYKNICIPKNFQKFPVSYEIPKSIEPNFAVVEVRSDALFLSGKPVLALENFLPPTKKEKSFWVPELYQIFQDMASPRKQFAVMQGTEECRFVGSLLLVIPSEAPATIEKTIVYNAGMAEFSKIHLLVQSDKKPLVLDGGKLQGQFEIETISIPTIK